MKRRPFLGGKQIIPTSPHTIHTKLFGLGCSNQRSKPQALQKKANPDPEGK